MNPGWRVVDCSSLEGSIHYQRGQLLIRSAKQDDVLIPLSQIAVLLIGTKSSVSGAVLMKLSEYDVSVLVCDWRNVPVAGAYPWASHSRVGARQQAQARLSIPRRKQAWARIVYAKIHGQAKTLASLDRDGSHFLLDIAKGIRSGDPDNREAQAAKAYWPKLSANTPFARHPGIGESGWNAALDYGYTLLRGHGIRAITSAGLIGSLGVFHRGRSNSFALVDDLMEPFRPFIDQIVFSNMKNVDDLSAEGKQLISASFTNPFSTDGKSIPTTFNEFAQQFGLYIEGQVESLAVPRWEGVIRAGEGI